MKKSMNLAEVSVVVFIVVVGIICFGGCKSENQATEECVVISEKHNPQGFFNVVLEDGRTLTVQPDLYDLQKNANLWGRLKIGKSYKVKIEGAYSNDRLDAITEIESDNCN